GAVPGVAGGVRGGGPAAGPEGVRGAGGVGVAVAGVPLHADGERLPAEPAPPAAGVVHRAACGAEASERGGGAGGDLRAATGAGGAAGGVRDEAVAGGGRGRGLVGSAGRGDGPGGGGRGDGGAGGAVVRAGGGPARGAAGVVAVAAGGGGGLRPPAGPGDQEGEVRGPLGLQAGLRAGEHRLGA